jgi:hypothetical protein
MSKINQTIDVGDDFEAVTHGSRSVFRFALGDDVFDFRGREYQCDESIGCPEIAALTMECWDSDRSLFCLNICLSIGWTIGLQQDALASGHRQ